MKRIKQKALRTVLLESTSDPDCGVIFSSIDLWQGKESVCLSTYEGPLGESLTEARRKAFDEAEKQLVQALDGLRIQRRKALGYPPNFHASIT